MNATGYITSINNKSVMVEIPNENIDKNYLLEHRKITECDVTFKDGRTISPEQRKRIFATLGDIQEWNGDTIDYLKDLFKRKMVEKYGCNWFSFKDTDMTTAKTYLTMLIDFCIENGVYSDNSYLERSEEVGKYLYACLIYKKCCICNTEAILHHIDRVGMGRDRHSINHIGMEAQALCGVHHSEVHSFMSQDDFNEKYHIYGIKIDKTIVKVYNL